jgi:hypothetical protein
MHPLLCLWLQDIKRSYRSLAQVFHPDKHLEDDLRDKAQEAFSKLQVCTCTAELYSSTVTSVQEQRCLAGKDVLLTQCITTAAALSEKQQQHQQQQLQQEMTRVLDEGSKHMLSPHCCNASILQLAGQSMQHCLVA